MEEIKKSTNGCEGATAEFKKMLRHQPKQSWVKEHPLYKGVKYIPIYITERLLDHLFDRWSVEVVSFNIIVNSIAVHVRLRAWKDGVEYVHDGLGAVPIQTKSGASPIDHNSVLTDAVMKALPAAKSFALKDASDHLGEIFGRSISRKGAMEVVQNMQNMQNQNSDLKALLNNK
jgi:hypothetical protein